ncbi:MAG TPA: hypothetical protein ENK77_02355 [Epsilonproteobacteria bacterium]|nr:hypothetical protein [Campylobacterota bacterium]
MINPQTQALLNKFSKIPLFHKYHAILIGGTALAYHLEHRVSYDLDICFPFADRLPPLDFLKSFEEVIPIAFDQGIIDTAINEGGDITETIRHYRITYLPAHIIQLIEAKKEDPFDTEGIENPKMKLTGYEELKSYLLEEISI